VVDFISYARFEVHTESSLEKMDKAWSVIHKNKSIFLELGIHENFNIPKFHSLIHYVSAICSHGTLDGYNTESSERLHIDFAKIPFRAGNKCDYTVQMTTWMSCQDAVWCQEMFLHWTRGKGILDDEGDEDSDEDMPHSKCRRKEKEEEDVDVRGCQGYKVAKKPSYGNVTADALINKSQAADEHFIWYLKEFLLSHSFPLPPTHNVPFGVFKRLSVTLPQIPQVSDKADLMDKIRTILPAPLRDRKKAVLAQFDTVLAFEKPGFTPFSDPLNPLKGMYSNFLCYGSPDHNAFKIDLTVAQV
jgi:hypothetical protein